MNTLTLLACALATGLDLTVLLPTAPAFLAAGAVVRVPGESSPNRQIDRLCFTYLTACAIQ